MVKLWDKTKKDCKRKYLCVNTGSNGAVNINTT